MYEPTWSYIPVTFNGYIDASIKARVSFDFKESVLFFCSKFVYDVEAISSRLTFKQVRVACPDVLLFHIYT